MRINAFSRAGNLIEGF